MRNLLIAGTFGLILTIGAAGGAYANNPNVPSWSPLSINTNIGRPMYYHPHRMSEHRAASVAPTPPDRPIFGSSEGQHTVTPESDSNSTAGSTGPANTGQMDR